MTPAEYALMQFLDRALGQPGLRHAAELHKAVVAEAVAAEREACAQIADDLCARNVAATIRGAAG
jgi:hypothetical protein